MCISLISNTDIVNMVTPYTASVFDVETFDKAMTKQIICVWVMFIAVIPGSMRSPAKCSQTHHTMVMCQVLK